MKNNEIKLCCGGKGCPVVRKGDDNTVEIKDDNGNCVTISAEQAKLLKNALEKFNSTE